MTEHIDPLVQTIVVLDVKDDPTTRNEVLANVAKASVAALNEHYGPIWEEWASGDYRKVVRRAKAKDFEKLVALDLPKSVINGQAVAFTPIRQSELPKEITRAQVSGLVTVDDDGNYYDVVATPDHLIASSEVRPVTVLINDDLGMSTGKMAAQVAHALTLFWRSAPVAQRWDFAVSGYPVHLVHVSAEEFRNPVQPVRHTVVDNGHTEIAPNTPTVLVL